MSSAVTSIDTATGGVKILWTAPNSNSDTITAYKIEIVDHTLTTWSQDLVHCDGTNSIIKSNLYCIVPMSVLITSPFNLLYAELVGVRISAQNTYGWSVVSVTNTVGATVRTIPILMNTPSRGTSTTISQIQVNWLPLSATADMGGSTILSYHLQWDAGSGSSGTTTWYDLIGLSADSTALTYTVTSGITGGNNY